MGFILRGLRCEFEIFEMFMKNSYWLSERGFGRRGLSNKCPLVQGFLYAFLLCRLSLSLSALILYGRRRRGVFPPPLVLLRRCVPTPFHLGLLCSFLFFVLVGGLCGHFFCHFTVDLPHLIVSAGGSEVFFLFCFESATSVLDLWHVFLVIRSGSCCSYLIWAVDVDLFILVREECSRVDVMSLKSSYVFLFPESEFLDLAVVKPVCLHALCLTICFCDRGFTIVRSGVQNSVLLMM